MIKHSFFLASIIVIISMLGISCENKIPVIPKSDLLTLPSLTARNFTTVVNDSGKFSCKCLHPLLKSMRKQILPMRNSDPE